MTPSTALDTELTAVEVLRTVLAHQRRAPDGGCTGPVCLRCLRSHLDAMRTTVAAGERIRFVLPAFPMKSPNPAKVLGPLPDTAEELALRFLASLCERITEVYPPGAEILICADGRVFSDLIGVPDADVTAYRHALQSLVERVGHGHLAQFTLDEVYTGAGHDEMRRVLAAGYGQDRESLRAEVRANPAALRLYRGITRFLVEDRLTPDYPGTKAALQRDCRDRAYEVISRSKAWGDLLGELFPTAVRLSIHPQACSADKIGILLADTPDTWLTPWHSVAVETGGRFTLMKRADAERAGARLVHVAGRPGYYSLPGTARQTVHWGWQCA
ncbi:pyoverdine/dityrosine biosynthesis protein Dit1 [Crossiella equi]|uniref:Pyoverdine/dityrosine biosynthesis protein Dit1 n=1 Tax=Crossiella equi TaxID=130796 RepID=A0ABS5A7I4_9PSEU|nr:isocyanide synthase family protein [Crossiella equi]MBP2472553.1 pyoverdine/dityrosine biosynthesis protein Dit1 [Crossiella equi]